MSHNESRPTRSKSAKNSERVDERLSGQPAQSYFTWFDIIRLGLVQVALGSIVVLTTSTMNRIMVIELALPASIPGALVGLHYAVQVLRPRLGHGSDVHGRRTPWIVGGVAVLGIGATLASMAMWVSTVSWLAAVIGSVLAFLLIGVGVGAGGTALLTFLAAGASPQRRAPAATIVWIMMIVGFVLTTAIVGQLLDPYTPSRLVAITAVVALTGWIVTAIATWGMEAKRARPLTNGDLSSMSGDEQGGDAELPTQQPGQSAASQAGGFAVALKQVWAEPVARSFAIFVFVSMLAYSAQDLILEPFAGSVFGMTPGQSTSLSSLQHGGVLIGMVVVALLAGTAREGKQSSLWAWTMFGCVASALALIGLAIAAVVGASWPIKANVFALGAANGAYAVAAIASMMKLVSTGDQSRQGLRMGIWGAAQALAFGLGGFIGAFASDIGQLLLASAAYGYGLVFAAEGILFLVSGAIAMRLAGKLVAPTVASPAIGARSLSSTYEAT